MTFDSVTATEAELDAKQRQLDADRESKLIVKCAAGIPWVVIGLDRRR
jgi:hypothetical protein